jgi:ribosome biogenesis protein Nip4
LQHTLQQKQAPCLLVHLTNKIDNSITSRYLRFRLTSLSFLARWAIRKLSYWQQFFIFA